jgi:hypothetical protein
MYELFYRVGRRGSERIRDDDGRSIQQFRFNGNHKAFARSDFDEFYELLESFELIWFNKNVVAFSDDTAHNCSITSSIDDRSTRGMSSMYELTFDEESFHVYVLNEPQAADKAIFDMLLESQGRRKINELRFQSSICSPFMFTSKAFGSFLKGNDQLQVLEIETAWISSNVCEVIGKIPHCLDEIVLSRCQLDLERLANAIEKNATGPSKIKLSSCMKEW